ncbi:hypothetical protein SAMN02745687_01185 [Lachnospiraceae bacterium NK3A20]|nr:hypothetical protein SAMN02745687_01185 [Lachnospiraceae bacterium NK3A20]
MLFQYTVLYSNVSSARANQMTRLLSSNGIAVKKAELRWALQLIKNI